MGSGTRRAKCSTRLPKFPHSNLLNPRTSTPQIQDGSWNEAVNAGRIKAVRGSLAEVREQQQQWQQHAASMPATCLCLCLWRILAR